jgi:hypothetical protein
VPTAALTANADVRVPCATAADCFADETCTAAGECVRVVPLPPCTSINDCNTAELCDATSSVCRVEECVVNTQCQANDTACVADSCTWPATHCFRGYCALACSVDASCPDGFACLNDQSKPSEPGSCLPSALPPRSQVNALLAGYCNATLTFPNETNGCVTFNEGGVYWAWRSGSLSALQITLVVPQAQLEQREFPLLGKVFVINPYSPYGVGMVFHQAHELERPRARLFDDYAKPGRLTKVALDKVTNSFDVSAPDRKDEVRWTPLHREIDLPSITGVTADSNLLPVQQVIYLEVFYNSLAETKVSEQVTYTLWNWFGDSTAVAGFFCGFGFWAGWTISQIVKP